MSWYQDFVAELSRPGTKCSCGHDEDSHNSGFSLNACMWCGCKAPPRG